MVSILPTLWPSTHLPFPCPLVSDAADISSTRLRGRLTHLHCNIAAAATAAATRVCNFDGRVPEQAVTCYVINGPGITFSYVSKRNFVRFIQEISWPISVYAWAAWYSCGGANLHDFSLSSKFNDNNFDDIDTITMRIRSMCAITWRLLMIFPSNLTTLTLMNVIRHIVLIIGFPTKACFQNMILSLICNLFHDHIVLVI